MASTLFYCEAEESYIHGKDNNFLEACSMCQRPLNVNRDIFMYKGNTAFCSSQCRQEQIEIDSRPWQQPKKSPNAPWDLSASWQAIRSAAAAVSWRPSTVAAAASTAVVTVDPEYFWF